MKKLAMTAGFALAMSMSAAALAHPVNSGYVTDSGDTVWRTGFGECWHTGTWGQDDATVEGCDGYQKMTAAAPAPTPAAPAPAMMAADKKFAVFFDFDSAVVDSVSDIANYVNGLATVKSIRLIGNADPIGSSAYNDALSRRRADNVAAALRSAGVDSNAMTVDALGETAPIAQCSGRGAALISCLRADRRVDVQISGKK
ncbi:OmpA family protein [Neptunomonas japonica]|uniref:OmpA-OmpF porin, OOP family n=1 Tax=Neptunomonas japonica JAMM 1380 TaxID=1441457 RepID=A0A7R6SVK7_9GAMM|nr:OmpA family protein [Neptunomonas japonica]BBB28830.1 OmpA-OmpF porin, OOP family [Neptunomonas japonica JAMM 1380]